MGKMADERNDAVELKRYSYAAAVDTEGVCTGVCVCVCMCVCVCVCVCVCMCVCVCNWGLVILSDLF